jgi:proliferating cell nuclear antigen
MDPAHVALIDILWPSSTFEKFECTRADRFTVRIEDFAKLIKRSEARDSVEISRSGNESIILKVGNEFYRREFELHLLESSAKSSPLPRLSFDAKFVMSYSAFAQALIDISTVSNHITLRTSNDRVLFSGKGDVGKALATFERSSSTSMNNNTDSESVYEIETKMREGAHEDSSSTYNLEYLLRMMKSIGASSSDTVKLEYSTKMPLRLEFGLAESASKGGRIHFYLAPRVGTAAE